jgi:hypothetical protein
LIQRGTCTFAEKVANAEAAGASAAIIFNEGNPGRTSVFSGGLAGDERIPVVFTSDALGTELLGSQYYVTTLPAEELARIKFDLDAEVTATPHYVAALFSADGTDAFMFQRAGIPASGVLTGQDCCKLASTSPCSAATRATSRAPSPATTAAASTTRSAGATTSATTTPRC